MEREVSLTEVLAAREQRSQRQQELLREWGSTLLSFTMNIAGPVKRSALIDRGFALGLEALEQQLLRLGQKPLFREVRHAETGSEAFYVLELPAAQVKAVAVELEERDELGRLFDMDVISHRGEKLEREKERGCLICGAPGRGCSRSRAHSVEVLQQRTQEILQRAVDEHDTRLVGELACRALLDEACTAPKPGLVDRSNSGSHTDMDLFTFMASAAALQPYFACCYAIGRRTAQLPPADTFAALRVPGKAAEGKMLQATGGVNTHKGAVFLMGLLCGAVGRLGFEERYDEKRLLSECAAMAVGVTERESAAGRTAGAHFYAFHGIRGIRGEAEDGFSSVSGAGLPTLRRELAVGKTLEETGCAALLALMIAAEDTALMHRAGVDGWWKTRLQARDILEAGVSKEALTALDEEMRADGRSPGGCADLLAVCYFLHFLSQIPENGTIIPEEE